MEELKQLACKTYYSFWSEIPRQQRKILSCLLKELNFDESIVITRLDKGQSVVISDRNDNITKINSTLNDSTNLFLRPLV